MTAGETALWRAIQRRAASLSPEMAAAIVRAFAAIRYALPERDLGRLVSLGYSDQLFDEILTQAVLNTAFAPVRDRLRLGVARGFQYAITTVPAPPTSSLAIRFDVLSPRVVDAIRTLETRVITTLASDIRDTFRATIDAGLRADANPKATARELRAFLGLSPTQESYVRNYRLKLEQAHVTSGAMDNTLRHRRFDGAIRRAQSSGTPLTAKEIETRADAYRRKMLAFNAETNARTATLDALKLGQRLSWEDAIDKGIVDRGDLQKTWVGVMDDRERPDHVAMEGATVPFDALFPQPSGEMIPGESTYNCRCLARYFVARA